MVGTFFIIVDNQLWESIRSFVFSDNFSVFDKTICDLCTSHTFIKNKCIDGVTIKFPKELTASQIEEIQLKDPYNMLYSFHMVDGCLCLHIVKSSIQYLKQMYQPDQPPFKWLADDHLFDMSDEI